LFLLLGLFGFSQRDYHEVVQKLKFLRLIVPFLEIKQSTVTKNEEAFFPLVECTTLRFLEDHTCL